MADQFFGARHTDSVLHAVEGNEARHHAKAFPADGLRGIELIRTLRQLLQFVEHGAAGTRRPKTNRCGRFPDLYPGLLLVMLAAQSGPYDGYAFTADLQRFFRQLEIIMEAAVQVLSQHVID